ncbi:hypothetical protein LCGC14_2809630, partial [marine sediment metagenome]
VAPRRFTVRAKRLSFLLALDVRALTLTAIVAVATIALASYGVLF